MDESNKSIKETAKAIIKISKMQPVVLAIIFTLLLTVISTITVYTLKLDQFSEQYTECVESWTEEIQGGNLEAQLDLSSVEFPQIKITEWLIVAALLIISRIMTAGFETSMLLLSRGRLAKVRNLFDAFHYTWKVPVICLLTTLLSYGLAIAGIIMNYVSVFTGNLSWSMGIFLVIPAVWFNFRYKYAIFALFDDESLSPFGAMKKSAQITRGHIWELITMYVSFVLWDIANTVISLFLGVGALDIWIKPFRTLSFCVKYNFITNWAPDTENPAKDAFVVWRKADFTQNGNTNAGFAQNGQSSAADAQRDNGPVNNSDAENDGPRSEESDGYAKNKEPDIEYWKQRAIELQRQMEEKNKQDKQ